MMNFNQPTSGQENFVESIDVVSDGTTTLA